MVLYFMVATSKPGIGNWVMKVCTANFNAFTSGLALTAISKSLSNLPEKWERSKEKHKLELGLGLA